MKKLLLLFVFFPLILGAQEQKKEYLFYHIRNFNVQVSGRSGYVDNGVGIRKFFGNTMEAISYFQNLGWNFEENWGPRYSFSKDVTGWTNQQVEEFLNKVMITDDRRSVHEIYSKRERKRLDEKAKELGLDPIKWP